MSLNARRLAAPLARLIAPGYTCCLHCGTPWKFVQPQEIWLEPPIREAGSRRGIIIVCIECWPIITRQELHDYTATIVYGTGEGWRSNDPWEPERAAAVMAVIDQLTPPAEQDQP